MKRFATMMGALLLMPTLALANSNMVSISELRQQVEAMGRWTQTYDTPNGEVGVDIPIIVPEVENMPILQVSAVMGKDVAEEKGLLKSIDQENAGAGILYDDFDILSKLNADVDDAAMIFCANPEEIDLAFLQVSHNGPNSMRRGSWDYSSDYYYPNEMNPETLFAEENEQPMSTANDALAVLLQNYYGKENVDYDVDYVEVRGRARKRVGRTKNDLGAYKKDYPKGTYYISFRQKLEGIPIYLEIGQKMLTTNQTHITQEVALKCSRISWININGLEYMDEESFMLNATWMREEKRIQADVPLATLDETVMVLSKLQAKQHIEIDLSMDELNLTSTEKKATYQKIRDYVLAHSGLKVSSLYIAQVKQRCGIIERENYNMPKSEDAKQPQCPPDKEQAIKEALQHFGMI